MKWVNIIESDTVFIAQSLAASAKLERENGRTICPP